MGTRVASFKTQYRLYSKLRNEHYETKTKWESLKMAIQVAKNQTDRKKIIAVLPVELMESYSAILAENQSVALHTSRLSEFCNLLAASETRVAAVVVVPDPRDLKFKGFLRKIRELASAEGALLIWDSTEAAINGFKEVASNGFFGINPDFTCWREEIQ